ncbi:Fibronectin type III domain containing protein 3C1, partial [Lemmus lemmus]
SPKDNGRKNIPSYNLEVSENSDSGQSQPSDILTIQTPTLPPVSCHSLPLNSKTKCKDTNHLRGK